jgi:hypothetical protein
MTDEQQRLSENYLFLSGAQMNPTAARAAYAGAQFMARARLQAKPDEVAAPFAQALAAGSDEIWGILFQFNGQPTGESRTAVTDDGREVQVSPRLPLLDGDPAAVLAAARYWELPPAYVERLATAVSGDGE